MESREVLLLLSTGMGDKWPGSDRASHVITLPIVLHKFLLIYVLLTPLQVSSSRPSNPSRHFNLVLNQFKEAPDISEFADRVSPRTF